MVHNADKTITVGDEVINTPEDLVGQTVVAFRGDSGAVGLAGHSVAAAGVADHDDDLLARAKVQGAPVWLLAIGDQAPRLVGRCVIRGVRGGG